MISCYQSEAEAAVKAELSYQEYLYKVLQQHTVVRVDNSVNTKIKKARFPFIKSLEEYDFTYQPKMDEKLIRELATLTSSQRQRILSLSGLREWERPTKQWHLA
ncbi:MAG: transposase/IS protein [Syntrophorhabdus sp. PtaU1.Bin153]|nr:MAG: transposase/IS protein [Syntrophorhabdus sp. PtaU1.Bin153]